MQSSNKINKESKKAVRITLIILAAILLLLLLAVIINSNRELQLELGRLVKGRLSANQLHSYPIKLTPNEYVRLSLARQGGDATITLSAQGNRKLIEMNGRSEGNTSVSTVSDGVVDITAEVRAITEIPVTYQLTMEEKRPSLSSDWLRIKAEKNVAEAERLYKEGDSQKYQEAIEKYQIAAEDWNSLEQQSEKAYSIRRIGNIYYLSGKLEQALIHYHQSLALYQQSNEMRGQVDVYNDLGAVYIQQGEREKAQESCTQAFRISQSVGYKSGHAQSFMNQGGISNILEQPGTALDQLKQALRLWEELEDYEKQASAYLEIGTTYFYLGQYKNAINSRTQALNFFLRIKNHRGQALTLTLLGHLYSTIGDKQEALNHYRLAYSILEKNSDLLTESSLAGGMSFVYTEMGETQKALEQRKIALALTQVIGYREDEALCFMHIGELHQLLGQHQQALSNLQQARNVAQAIKDRRIEAQVLRSIGEVYQSLRETKTAMQYYQQAVALYPQTYSSRWKAYAYNKIGEISAQEGNLQKAIAQHQQALEYNLFAEDRFGESQTRYHLARANRYKGNWPEAVAQSQKAVALIESLRFKVFSQGLRTSYFASVNQIYELYIDVLLQRQRERPQENFAAEALTISERARARSLLDLLNDSRHDIKQGADPKLLEQERTLLQTLNGKAERKMQLTAKKEKEQELATLNRELESLHTHIEDVRAKMRETSPRYAALTQPQPLKAAEIQQQLDDNTMLLEFALGEERSYLWAVTKDSLEAFTLPNRTTIEKLSNEVYALMTAPQKREGETFPQWLLRIKQAPQQYWPKAAELSQLLLSPIAEKLGHQRLIVVGEGALQRIPFAALPVPEFRVSRFGYRGKSPAKQNPKRETRNAKPLIVNHEIINLPSASILEVLRQERARRQAAASQKASLLDSIWTWFGKGQMNHAGRLDSIAILADPVFEKADPRVHAGQKAQAPTSQPQTRDVDLSDENLKLNRLPETAVEAGEIGQAAGANAFLLKKDFAVNRALLESDELNRYGIIHFATHGFWDSEQPELSGIVLSRYDQQGNKLDGFLRLSDIYNLRLPKELVVLSACETAIGKDIRGEGLMALTRGFMYAGASRVMASLWKVEESATVDLMKVFYEKLFREKLTPAAALREAQIAMWRRDPASVPYDWGAFVLQGEYR